MLSNPPLFPSLTALRAARLAPVALVALTAACQSVLGPAPGASDDPYVIQTSFSAGTRSVDPETRLGSATLFSGGVEVDWFDPASILGYEVGVTYGRDKDAGVRTSFTEGYAGLRKTWLNATPFVPYVGGGVSLTSVDPNRTFQSFESWGGYVHAGAYWVLPESLFSLGIPVLLGLDLRAMEGDALGYTEGRVFLGFRGP